MRHLQTFRLQRCRGPSGRCSPPRKQAPKRKILHADSPLATATGDCSPEVVRVRGGGVLLPYRFFEALDHLLELDVGLLEHLILQEDLCKLLLQPACQPARQEIRATLRFPVCAAAQLLIKKSHSRICGSNFSQASATINQSINQSERDSGATSPSSSAPPAGLSAPRPSLQCPSP